MKKFITTLAVIFSISVPLLSISPAFADTFNPNHLIDDGIFDNYNSMDVATINNWLNSNFPSSCISSKNGFSTPDPQGWSASQNKYLFGGNVTAGQAIHDAAVLYHINPQVILSTLQKEQAIPNGGAGCYPNTPDPNAPFASSPSSSNTFTCNINSKDQTCTYACTHDGGCMNIALGYGCPYYCAAADEGFSMQITLGTWLLRFGEQRAEGNLKDYVGYESGDEYLTYSGPMTPGTRQRSATSPAVYYYDGSYTTVDGTTVTIATGSTATLYNFTPFISGNSKFVTIFHNWFGGTYTNCTYPPSTAHAIYRLYDRGTGNQLLTGDSSEVCAATSVGWLYDGLIFNDETGQGLPVYRLENGGRYLFTASTTERDTAVSKYGYTLDGVAFNGVDPSIDPTNARAVYRLASPIGTYLYTISPYERDAFVSNNGYKYEGISFYLRENPGAAIAPVYRLANPNGAYLLTLSAAERDNATQFYGYRSEGTSFNAISQLNQDTVPIYRLAGPGGYLFTTNLAERNYATNIGYRNEGIQMFTYGTMNDPSLNKVYRLARSGSYLYTTSTAERDLATQSYGFRLEGISFLVP